MTSQAKGLTQRLRSGAAWAIIGRVVTLATNLLISGLLARLLTPGDMGSYFLIFSLSSFLVLLVQFGLPQVLVRFVAEALAFKHYDFVKADVYRAIVITGIFSFLLVITMWVMNDFVANILRLKAEPFLVVIMAVWICLLAYQGLVAETFRGMYDMRSASIFGGVFSNLIVCLFFLFTYVIYGRIELLIAVCAFTVAAGVSLLISGISLHRRLTRLVLTESASRVKKPITMLKMAWPLWISSLTFLMLVQADVWIVSWISSPEDVAVYGAAARLVSLVAMSLVIANAVTSPLIAEYYSQGKLRELEFLLRRVATLASVPAIIGIICFVSAASQILELIYGTNYKTGANVLVILSLGHVFNVLSGACGLTLTMTGHQLIMMIITIISGALTILMAIVLGGYYGINGVASAFSLGLIFQNVFMLLAVKKYVGIWTSARYVSISEIKQYVGHLRK